MDKTEFCDELEMAKNELIPKLCNFAADERILYSSLIQKINQKAKAQERVLLITNKAIYNLVPLEQSGLFTHLLSKMFHSLKVKRVIPLDKISAISVSSNYMSFEFVIHVKNDYDYRYDAKFESQSGNIADKRDIILLSIARGLNYFFNLKLPLILVEDVSLEAITTTEKDFKEKRSRMPQGDKLELTPDDLADGLSYVIKKQFQYRPLQSLTSFILPQDRSLDDDDQELDTNPKQKKKLSYIPMTEKVTKDFEP